jgi:hypothetical protein
MRVVHTKLLAGAPMICRSLMTQVLWVTLDGCDLTTRDRLWNRHRSTRFFALNPRLRDGLDWLAVADLRASEAAGLQLYE